MSTQADPTEAEGVPLEAASEATVEAWCASKSTPAWLFAAARMLRRWPIGQLVDEQTYDAALEEAAHVPLSSPSIRTR